MISTGTNYEYVHSTAKLYSSGTIPIYPLSIYARDNPPSAQPRLGVSIEERPLRGRDNNGRKALQREKSTGSKNVLLYKYRYG